MTRAARSRARDLADELQRRRGCKAYRFTANDLFRCFIESGLELFELDNGERVDTYPELRDLFDRKLSNWVSAGSEVAPKRPKNQP